MGKLVDYVTSLHTSTKRSYIDRMNDNKVECMIEAKKYGKNYWDGDRRYGYGGYKFINGRWKPVAEILIKKYSLNNSSSILDIGCGKGFLLHEMKLILPELKIVGMDASEYAIQNCKPEIKKNVFLQKAEKKSSFKNDEFDLVISINTLHNLKIFDLKSALNEMQRVGKQSYLCLESYRNERELFNLECWALTCQSFYTPDEWIWIYKNFGYKGDYEFIYFV